MVLINPGGGVLADGSDGLKTLINAEGPYAGISTRGQDQFYFAGTGCTPSKPAARCSTSVAHCSAKRASPSLQIAGQAYVTQAWLRPRAEADLIDRTARYRSTGGDDLGKRFFNAALASLRSMERTPGIGSPLTGEMCDIPGLRSCAVEGFPVHWFCFVADDHLDVVRLLGDAQDLPAILGP